MNKTILKSYAPQARKDFIAAVTARANQLGLSYKAGSLEVAPAQTQGDVTVIAGQAWPSKVSGQRDKLIERIRKDGFEHTMEAVAYTWFNRFAALRYMELHDYLGHGHRALSSAAGGLPDILTHATDLSNDLPGLNTAQVTELKLAGNRDGELYRMLLVAQCNALSRAMPFLFERIDDDSELLLPDNLLRSDSVIAKLVAEISEEDWAEVEIIGWLYQFYISEKKDQVIGKVVKSEDIPAATQLFTPNWIVQYLVQNSVGRLWLMANPQSTLAGEWPYYITPAEQTPEVQAQLDALIQTRVREDGDTLNPESITVLDPACGSGHILVVAYDVLKSIYLERGYQPRTIPRLILEKNLFGLDIDDRAAQMAGFALLMKARADDRRLFTATDDAGNLQPPKLNVLSLQESKGLSVDELATHLAPFQVKRATINLLLDTFKNAKTFGTLIKIPSVLEHQINELPQQLLLAKNSGDMYASASAEDLIPLVKQAQLLTMHFDSVIANPPYMGSKGMNPEIKEFAKTYFPDSKSDLLTMFMERGFKSCKACGFNSMVTMQSWMFLSSFESMRMKLLTEKTLQTMAHLGARAFSEISGEVVQTTSFVFLNKLFEGFRPTFFRLIDGQEQDKISDLKLQLKRFNSISQSEFSKIPGSPLVYWISEAIQRALTCKKNIETEGGFLRGHSTANNDMFLRLWPEVNWKSISTLGPRTAKKWHPYNKGGENRKWYGNRDYVINWNNDGELLKNFKSAYIRNLEENFKPCIAYSSLTSGEPSFRFYEYGLNDQAGNFLPVNSESQALEVISSLNSSSSRYLLSILSSTLNILIGDLNRLPLTKFSEGSSVAKRLIEISKDDWNAFERSWDFDRHPLLSHSKNESSNLEQAFSNWIANIHQALTETIQLEDENNKRFALAYGLDDELISTIQIKQITLTVNTAYRYGENTTEEEKNSLFRQDTVIELISYIVGCIMGRYSLDEPGLVYAEEKNISFNSSRYRTFEADADGIVPITDEIWFADDAPSRVREFLRAVWGPDTLEENMAWLAESLGTKGSETPDETIRRYIADKFFKDHLQTYKKRPIYWLFSSGKQGAFQALVYLHRYHEGTLARLRAEYVVPLTSKIQSRIEMLQKDAAAATSTAARNKLAKEVEKLKKKHVELLAYDEQLRHYADMRITLDLDDGVKVNYGKFGDLLAEVKAVTGGASDD
jgi:type II restriction/modification system DNA methylase subunit YeeA